MFSQHIDGEDVFASDRLRLPSVDPAMEGSRTPIPRHSSGEAFLGGPIPFAWIGRASKLPGSGLPVALTYRFLAGRFRKGRDRRWDLETVALGLNLSDDSVRRGLKAAEGAGLLAVSRSPGSKILASDVSMLEMSDDKVRLPLRGPIPWSWLRPALLLPVAGLRVGLACWCLAGLEHSGRFELALGEWSELGLSRFAAGRGLEALERAGLVAVERRAGNSPIVVLRAQGGSLSGGAGGGVG